MRRWNLMLACLLALGALSIASCNMDRSGHNSIRGGGLSMERPSSGCVGCDHAMKHDGWCDTHNCGYINGHEVKCKGCVEASKNHTDCKTCGTKATDMPRK